MTAERIVILGATGDLAGRYLLAALAELHHKAMLPENVEVVGVALDEFDDQTFREHAAARLRIHAGALEPSVRDDLVRRLRYVKGDATDVAAVMEAIAGSRGRVLIYLALPPILFEPAIEAIASARVHQLASVVVEKPFGTDLASAKALNRLLHRHFAEKVVFRIDHFLGKQTVQNVLGLRFANRLFEPLWCAEHIERVEIVWDETVALEGRAGYYDQAGALRDMVQNHLLQLVCFVAMERPTGLGEAPLRDAKLSVLRAVRRFDESAIRAQTVRGRYTAGTVGGKPVRDYISESGVEAENATETFADVTLFIDNDRWRGVPFRLRTGKALAVDRRHIEVRFRPVARLPFGQHDDPGPNVLTLSMNPDRLSADLALNGAGDPFCLDPVRIELELAPQELSAYARLVVEALQGDASLATRGDEAEESWRIVEPILAAWARGTVPLAAYRAGSHGPTT